MTTQDLSAWIGRTETSHDRISHNLVKRVAATLSAPAPGPGDALPLLWHWAFFQDTGYFRGSDGLGSLTGFFAWR